jgi:Fe-S cluster assembly ATP-binding protein
MPPAVPLFEIDGLRARPTGAPDAPEILKGIDLTVLPGEVHAIMGPNGSGKSTLASTLLASPEYEVTGGRIRFKGDDITTWDTEIRGKAGMFLAFQYPQQVQGVSVLNFLRQALSARKGIDLSMLELRLSIMEWMERLDMDPSFADRFLNEGFSGGEKKRNEILQMAILEPEIAILDETDSGLDIDALKVVAQGVQEVRRDRPELGVVAITHYQRLLDHLTPDVVHILIDGEIVASGGMELAERLERDGYDGWRADS